VVYYWANMNTATPTVRPPAEPFALDDRYRRTEGRVFLSGLQAIVRVLLDQQRTDAAAGLRTGTLVSGYQGSPLAGFDKELERLGSLAAEHHIVVRPAINEELGATAVWGSQLLAAMPGARHDGVVGVWYGKAPGVDRASDAIRHGNFVGTSPQGGVLACCGDDPGCVSSTIPCATEALLASLRVPVFAPGSVQEVLDLGRHAIACSRASGLWSALKMVTAVADATAVCEVGPGRVAPVLPSLEWEGSPYVHTPSARLLAPDSLEMERTLVEVRLPLARRYAALNALNTLTCDSPDARLGIVVAGTVHQTLWRALEDLGLASGAPLRVLRMGMLFPLDEACVRDFARGLDEILVIEEKGPFLERLVKEALYGGAATPLITGTHDDRGMPLVPAVGALDSDALARVVARRLLVRAELAEVRRRLELLDVVDARARAEVEQRTPFFCSGCPHNSSTVVPDGTLVGAGIGCHTMVMLNSAGRGIVAGVTQMGGEGAQWIGLAPFMEPRHYVQNLGDGTFHHSGSLAIRAAVAAGVDVTFKLLRNSAVAMTGGQQIEGELSLPALVGSLEAEGVRRIVVTTDEPERYRDLRLGPRATVRDRRELAAVQRELAELAGVTVLIHDQECAAELRRARKRGKAPEPPQRVIINERVCEGCGDCGEKSNCLSVEPVSTEFGRKTRINQSSCNKDLSCLEGDCPSFLTVTGGQPARRTTALDWPAAELPQPALVVPLEDVTLRLVGIGGTGVVTVSQILGVAALLDGRHASGLDQTGLSQKGGPVISDVRIASVPPAGGAVASAACADALLGFDLLGAAAPRNLRVADPERTVAIVSTSIVPTGRMVVEREHEAPDAPAAMVAIEQVTRSDANFYLDGRGLATALFGDEVSANVIVLGAAWQRGVLPLSREAMHGAIRLNGAGAEQNLAAFEWGRACVGAPEELVTAIDPGPPPRRELGARERALVERVTTTEGELRRLLEIRVADLVGWGGMAVATRYAAELERVYAAERARLPDSSAVTEAVARGLHKLIAYKDEYEVARLHLEAIAALPLGSRVSFRLHPPMLRALGMQRKLALGRWFTPVLRLLRHGRRLRGTPLDPNRFSRMRRLERALPGEYLALITPALERLSPATLGTVLEIAELPELIRGYESIKLAGVQRFRSEAQTLVDRLDDAREAQAA
jgi:indolepyruvate ferredoxin oxidoreductase